MRNLISNENFLSASYGQHLLHLTTAFRHVKR